MLGLPNKIKYIMKVKQVRDKIESDGCSDKTFSPGGLFVKLFEEGTYNQVCIQPSSKEQRRMALQR